MLLTEIVPQTLEHGGLSRPDLTRQHDESFASLDPINKVRQSFFVLFAAV
jgi:hypothetical protein